MKPPPFDYVAPRDVDEALALVREGDDGRGRPSAFGVFDDFGRRAFHDSDAGIGGAEVDTNDLTHGGIPHFQADRRAPKRPGPWLDVDDVGHTSNEAHPVQSLI